MKKILLSIAMIGAVAAIGIGATTAYFSDTETSTGNTFTAGAIDLKIGNESYVTNNDGVLVASPATSWSSGDLTIEKFFNFSDLKPGDVGEDTIGLTVNTNDSWGCAELTMTSNNDNGCSDPEMTSDPSCNPQSTDPFDGELADEIQFVWWPDDGDNVLEIAEEPYAYYLSGTSIHQLLGDDNKLELTMADSQLNFFTQVVGDPLNGNQIYNIGKGWCFGTMALTPLEEGTTGPLVRGTGFSCNGEPVTNASQTDKLTADLAFTVVQSRNNPNYLCPEHD